MRDFYGPPLFSNPEKFRSLRIWLILDSDSLNTIFSPKASAGDFCDIFYPNKRKGRITPSSKKTTPIM
jgi:hypothetical protein